MSQVSYIRGHIPMDERLDRAANIGTKSYVPAVGVTDGQLGAVLLHRQLNILAKYYPEIKDYKVAADAVVDALSKGVHEADLKQGGSNFYRAINKKISSFKLKRRASLSGGERLTNTVIQHYLSGGTGSPFDGLDFKSMCMEAYNSQFGTNFNNWNNLGSKRIVVPVYCQDQVDLVTNLNDYLDPSGHHLLYEWAPANPPGDVSAKRILHRNAVAAFAGIINATRSNMAAWFRSGVMLTNAERGAEPVSPEESYNLLKAAWSEAPSVGAPPVAVIIIGAVTAAIGATTTLIQSLKADQQNRLRSQAQGIGFPSYGPEGTDFPFDGTAGSLVGGNSMLPLILLGGGAVLLLTSSSKDE